MSTIPVRHAIAATIMIAASAAASHMDSAAVVDNYETVLYNPAHYEQTRVLWGAVVQEIDRTPDGWRLVFAEIPLDFLGGVGAGKYSRGRFVGHTADAGIAKRFSIGDLAIVEGRVEGSETLAVGEENKTYPLITIERIDRCRRSEGYGYVKGPMGWQRVEGPFCVQDGDSATTRK
jgi:starvation-inducible outer membrane lipoprotein